MRVFAALAIFAVVTGAATGASAATFSYDFEITNLATADPGLVVHTDPAPNIPAPGNFTLDTLFQSTGPLPLFSIWTNETAVNSDDRTPQEIQVAFAFSSPLLTSGNGVIDGETVGQSVFFGLFDRGNLDWTNSTRILAFDDGSRLRLTLSSGVFNAGFLGLKPGEADGLTVYASFKLKALPTVPAVPVPLPLSAPVFAGGLIGLGLAARRRAASDKPAVQPGNQDKVAFA